MSRNLKDILLQYGKEKLSPYSCHHTVIRHKWFVPDKKLGFFLHNGGNKMTGQKERWKIWFISVCR
jgi:hypothetical protein